MNVCFKILLSNQLPIPGFKHSSPERATVVAIGVVRYITPTGAAEQVKPVKHVLHRNLEVLLQRNF